MAKKNEWSDILTGIAGFDPTEGKAISGLNTTPKDLFTEAKKEKATPTPPKHTPVKKQPAKERKITTARIDQRKLLLIKFIYSDGNAFEALDKVVDFWIENNQEEISTKFDKAMDWLNQ